MRVRLALGQAALALLVLSGRASAQDVLCDPGEREMRHLEFVGNRTYRAYVLERGIETTAPSFWRRLFRVIGRSYCLDSVVVARDSLRLWFEYQKRGFSDVRITPKITLVGARRADVRFTIVEGVPTMVDSLVVRTEPPDEVVPDWGRLTGNLPLRVGSRFENDLVRATHDTITRRLRDHGYPMAEVLLDFTVDRRSHRASVLYKVVPGERQRIGAIRVDVTGRRGRVRIDSTRIRESLGIHEGEYYRETSMEGVKRGLYLTQAFRHVDVTVDTMSLRDASDGLLTVAVRLSEGDLKAARAAVGVATLDCVRTQATYTNYNFTGRLRRLDFAGRLSKIGIDPPFDGFRGLCSSALRKDPLSDTLNFYLGATITQPALFGRHTVPSITVFTERRSEFQAFLRETPVGVLASALQGLDGAFPMTWSYQLEYGRTIAQPAFFCAVFNVCEADARSRLQRLTRTAVLGWSATRSRTNDLFNPSAGSTMRIDLRHASPVVGSATDVRFNRASVDASWYHLAPLGGTLVLRLRGGAVLGSKLSLSGSPTFIPLAERLYAGGPSTVRGFRQNELGPSIYLPTDEAGIDKQDVTPGDTLQYWRADPTRTSQRVVPTGGDNVVVANAEWRIPDFFLPELLQYSLFLDAGQVWNRGRSGTRVDFRDIVMTPGVGVAIFTAVGPIRLDVGYNRYRRPSGPAYITSSVSGSSSLICVSPGNLLRVRVATDSTPAIQVDQGDCPGSYRPESNRNFWRRLTFQFSIGQPF